MSCKKFTVGLIQLKVGADKVENIRRALNLIREATSKGSKIVALPECFNSPYGTKFFPQYAEEIPNGDTSAALAQCAKENKIYLIGGSIPEVEGDHIFNTCTVWGPTGELLAKHRKTHLFDIDITGGVRFKESETLSPGNKLTTVQTEFCKIGLGICYDLRFEEMARLYQKQGCEMILYPGAFNMNTGPLHWELLLRSRAVDNQLFSAGIAPAQDKGAGYISYGNTTLVSPWGKVIAKAGFEEEIVIADVDLQEVYEMRKQIPTGQQRREDLYETIGKKEIS